MLSAIGTSSLAQLISEVVPADIRLARPMHLPEAESEAGYFRRLREIAARNVVARSYIGLGYHDTATPAVILRNVFENPGWYTPYTPYQAEIAQGRLESLLNFQTMVSELTGMEVANASLLDEATAAAEAMTLLKRVSKRPAAAHTFLVSERIFPQTRALLETRATPLGVTLKYVDVSKPLTFDDDVYGLYLQTPDDRGEVHDLEGLIASAHAAGVPIASAPTCWRVLVTPPARWAPSRPAARSAWRAARLRRSARVLRHARSVCASGAGPHHRRLGRREGPSGLPHGPADPRTAHPP
jgi:glycine dehydrogenase